MASTSQSKRLPVSCEPCRKRKIRCTRNRPPCNTCLRRGLGPAECVYLGQPKYELGRFDGDTSNLAQEELFQRIRKLEDLLQKHVGSSVLAEDNPTSPPPSNEGASSSPSCNGSAQHEAEKHNQGDTMSDQMSEVAQNIGSLNISSSGYVRFEPQSSMLNSQIAQQSTRDYTEKLNNEEEPTGFPFTWEVPPKRSELLGRLPPRPYCDKLKDVYIRVFSPLFHILHDPTFEKEYEQFREDPNSVSLSWLALLYVVLAIAVNAVDSDHPLLPDLGRENSTNANMKTLSARYRTGAMQCLGADNVMVQHSVRTLQALVLLIYALNHSSQPSWVLVGMTHHIAISMGCHVDPSHFDLDIVQAEERRRCWSGLVMLHMMQKISFRNLDEQRLSRRVRLPLDLNDVDLVDGANISQPPAGPTQMTYILYKFRLYDIALAICDQIFGSQTPSTHALSKLDQEISAQQEEWGARYASDSQHGGLPDHHIAHMNILFGYSYQLSLLLHRPSLNRYLSGEVNEATRRSRNKCLKSSLGLLSIQKHLAGSPEFAPYKWYTGGLASFHAFHAAVVLATLAMNPESLEESEQIHEALKDTVQVFQQLASRSSLCEKAVPILTKLFEVTCSRPNSLPRAAPAISTTSGTPSTNIDTPTTSDLEIVTSSSSNQILPQNLPLQYQQQSYTLTSTSPPLAENKLPDLAPQLNPQGASTMEMPIATPMTTEAIQAQLNPEYWLGPASVAWGNWNFLMADPDAQLYQQQYQQQYQQHAYHFANSMDGMPIQG